jgi:hypothetical protein
MKNNKNREVDGTLLLNSEQDIVIFAPAWAWARKHVEEGHISDGVRGWVGRYPQP